MLKKVLRRMCAMSDGAWLWYRRGFQLCIALLSCGLLLTAGAPGGTNAYRLLRTAGACFDTAEGVLLLTVLLPVIIEELELRKR